MARPRGWTRRRRRTMRGLRRRLGFSVRRRRQRRYSWRRARRGAGTKTRVVKFQTQITMPFLFGGDQTTSATPSALNFTATTLPGFLEWQATMSEFRFLKAKAKVSIEANSGGSVNLQSQRYAFLRVPSRQFVCARALSNSASGIQNHSITQFVGSSLAELRQSKFTKQLYPNDTRNALEFGFYPYTLQWSGKPYSGAESNTLAGTSYLEYRSARRWMSMSFLGPTNSPDDDVSFIGPYLVRLLADSPDTQILGAWTATVLLTVYAQFRGQK